MSKFTYGKADIKTEGHLNQICDFIASFGATSKRCPAKFLLRPDPNPAICGPAMAD